MALFFLTLPVSVFFALAKQRDLQIYWWCLGGVFWAISFALVSLRDVIPHFLSFYIAHATLAIGVSLRALSLRLEQPKNIKFARTAYALVGLIYLGVYSVMVYFDINEFYRLFWVYLFFLMISVDLLFLGQRMDTLGKNKGGALIAWMGMCLVLGALARMVGHITGLGGVNAFSPGTDQFIGLVLIFVGYVLGNFGFLQMRLEKLWARTHEAESQLGVTSSKNNSLEVILEEKNTLMRTLSLSAKANNMGTMLGAIAHEINQPLGAIRLNTEFLLASTQGKPDFEDAQEILKYILQDNVRASIVVANLRKFFIKGGNDLLIVDMSQLVRETYQIIFLETRYQAVNLHTEIEAHLWVHGDLNQLQLVVLNLLRNAMDAVAELKVEKNIIVKLFRKNQNVVLEVSDNGVGVTEEQAATIFDLFYSTKTQGMGMGLWLCKAIMDSHEGMIAVSKGPENETLFRVSLPVLK